MSADSPSDQKQKVVVCDVCGSEADADLSKCPFCGSPLIAVQPQAAQQFETVSSVEPPRVTESTFSVQNGKPIEINLQEIALKVNTLWEERTGKEETAPPSLHLPKHVEDVAPREVLKPVKDIQRCYEHNIPNACPGLLRKALASAIKIKFYRNSLRSALYDDQGNRKGDLLDWIEMAKQRGYLTQELARELKRAKIFGDFGVHDERIDFDQAEVSEVWQLLRLAIEQLFKTA